MSLAEPGDPDLPITAFEGGGPPIVQGVEGIGIRAGTSAAVAFAYDTAAEANGAASTLGVAASGTVVVVADAAFPPAGQAAVVECLGGEAPTGGGGGGVAGGGVSPDSAACVAGRGFELTEPGATDLPITDADGEGLPVINGVAGIGIRGASGAAAFYPYPTEAEANEAFTSFTSNPDVVLVGARVDAIAVDNVFIASDPGFPSDERFFLADCFD